MNNYIAFSAYFGAALTLLVYLFACRLGKRLHHPLANPMLLCLIMMIALLLLCGSAVVGTAVVSRKQKAN